MLIQVSIKIDKFTPMQNFMFPEIKPKFINSQHPFSGAQFLAPRWNTFSTVGKLRPALEEPLDRENQPRGRTRIEPSPPSYTTTSWTAPPRMCGGQKVVDQAPASEQFVTY